MEVPLERIAPGCRVALGLALAVAAAACSPTVSINERIAKRDGERFSMKALACYGLGDGISSGSGGGGGDFAQSTSVTNGVLKIEVRTDGRLLVQRTYDQAFAHSGRVDDFTVATTSGDEYRFVYWGSSDCELGVRTQLLSSER
jgi:hypothetical protein